MCKDLALSHFYFSRSRKSFHTHCLPCFTEKKKKSDSIFEVCKCLDQQSPPLFLSIYKSCYSASWVTCWRTLQQAVSIRLHTFSSSPSRFSATFVWMRETALFWGAKRAKIATVRRVCHGSLQLLGTSQLDSAVSAVKWRWPFILKPELLVPAFSQICESVELIYKPVEMGNKL